MPGRYPEPPRRSPSGGRGTPGLRQLPPELDPRGRHRRDSIGPRRLGRRHARIATEVLAATLSALLLVTFGIYWWENRSFTNGAHRLSIFGGASAATKPSKDIDGKDQNLLIVGNDDRQTATDAELRALHTGRDGGSLNTDTMMIVHVPADGRAATLISLPRDSYVSIPGYGMSKLNSAYPDAYNAATGSTDAKRAAGAKLLITIVQNLTGLTIDHFVSVDLIGFYDISEAIGGVKVNMCAAVKEPDSGIDLPKGVSTIKGTQALAFVRQRYDFPNGLGDLDRVERQRYFLTAAFRRITTAGELLNPIKLDSLLKAVQRNLYMDSGLNPLQLAQQMSNLSADNIVGKTIPTTGFATEDGASVVTIDPFAVKSFVTALIGPVDPLLAKAKLVNPATVTVDVLNASDTNDVAATNAATLRTAHFQTGTVGSAPSPAAVTVIEYPNGMQSQAKTLAGYVPGAVLQEVTTVSRVTLVLGQDGKSVSIPKPASSHSGSAAPKTTAPKSPAIDSGCIN
jgi:LCP family protein required for cell wall assembly